MKIKRLTNLRKKNIILTVMIHRIQWAVQQEKWRQLHVEILVQ